MIALAIAALIGTAALMPSFLRGWFALRAAESAVRVDMAEHADDAALDAAKSQLASAGALVTALSGDLAPSRYSALIAKISSIRQPARISAISLSFGADGTASVALAGSAASREELLAFKDRLQAAFPGAKVDIPIAQLAKSSDLAFNIRFDVKPQ
jgi:hypothetical protein